MSKTTLFAQVYSDSEIAAQFSDDQFVAYMVQVEAALAKVQAQQGIIPPQVAKTIEQAVADFRVDKARLQVSIEKAGIPAIGLVQQLREHVGGDAATYVHWGATSQDIMDTALVLQIRAALEHLEAKLQRLLANLADLAQEHRQTLMAGRTHAQHALPFTFGLKVAGWLAPLLRQVQRLSELRPRLLVVQLGGATGTLASLGEAGLAVQQALARELGLGVPRMTWHTQRDNLAEFASWLSLLTAGLAKMAQDIILMAQSEIAELRESDDPERGGSSTMPQKHNPMQSEAILAAARSNASHVSALHHALIQEHERATGSWQIEWLNLPPMLLLTGAALNRALFLSENLVVNSAQMQANVTAANGLLLAEALELALAPHLGRTAAKRQMKAACQTALEQGRHLVDVVREQVDFELDWETLRDESAYLGQANALIDRVLDDVQHVLDR